MEINDNNITEPIPQFQLDSMTVQSLVSTLKISKDDIIIIHLVGDMSDIQDYVQKTVSIFDRAKFKNPIIFMNADNYVMCINDATPDLKDTLDKLAADSSINVTKDSKDFDITDILGKF